MFLKVWLNYITGYVNIKVESYFIERFINICISKNIFLWNMKRKKSTILYANIGIKDYKRLKEVCKKTKSKINIESKKGLPFILHRYRKRKIFLGLLVVVILGLIVTSNFIWNVEITGNTNISTEEIKEELENQGLKAGISKTKIDSNSIINKIRLNRDDIAWIGIKLEGTNAIVEIKEKDAPPEIIDDEEYCNIVSNKTASITKISVQNGTAAVGVGDIVKEGDILVQGYLEGKYTGIRYVHAQADIEAKVWYSKKEKFYFTQEIEVPTGNMEKKYTLNIDKLNINLFKNVSKFQNYNTTTENKRLKLFSNFYLPIGIIKTINYEYEKQDVTYTKDELIEKATDELEGKIEEEIENKENIVNKQVNVYENDGYIEVEVIYEVLEKIGNKEKIFF